MSANQVTRAPSARYLIIGYLIIGYLIIGYLIAAPLLTPAETPVGLRAASGASGEDQLGDS